MLLAPDGVLVTVPTAGVGVSETRPRTRLVRCPPASLVICTRTVSPSLTTVPDSQRALMGEPPTVTTGPPSARFCTVPSMVRVPAEIPSAEIIEASSSTDCLHEITHRHVDDHLHLRDASGGSPATDRSNSTSDGAESVAGRHFDAHRVRGLQARVVQALHRNG